MSESGGHALIDAPYQGNWWWLATGVFAVWLVYYMFLTTRRKRKAGIPVEMGAVIFVCLLASFFAIVSLFQVLTHAW